MNGLKHFAINEDGNGIERGTITYELAYGERSKSWDQRGIDEDGNPITVHHVTRGGSNAS